MLSKTWTPIDDGAGRRRWSQWFAATTIPGAWAIAWWCYFSVQIQTPGSMRGFGLLPLGLGLCATVCLLQLGDALAWRLDASKREPVFALAASLSLLALGSAMLFLAL